MYRRQYPGGTRHKLDLNDRVQVRIVRKRQNVSSQQLASQVRAVGDSIEALGKEARARRLLTLPGNRTPTLK
jgi:hypothetical protein